MPLMPTPTFNHAAQTPPHPPPSHGYTKTPSFQTLWPSPSKLWGKGGGGVYCAKLQTAICPQHHDTLTERQEARDKKNYWPPFAPRVLDPALASLASASALGFRLRKLGRVDALEGSGFGGGFRSSRSLDSLLSATTAIFGSWTSRSVRHYLYPEDQAATFFAWLLPGAVPRKP